MSESGLRFDPFKPPDPRIPGVPGKSPPVAGATSGPWRASPWLVRLGLGSLAALACGGLLAWWTLGRSAGAPADSAGQSPEPSGIAPAKTPAKAPPPPPEAPGAIAAVGELDRPWSSKEFVFRRKDQRIPALLVRLPGGSALSASSYWAFSRREVLGRCELELVTNLRRLVREFGFRARHPMVVNPCSHAVYDPLRYGDLGGGVVVRGDVAAGPGIRPPLAIDVLLRNGRIFAVQIE